MDKLLTVQDIMRIFTISRRTVYDWIKKDILQPLTIGGVCRFHPDDIDRLIEKSRRSGAPAPPSRKHILAIDDDDAVLETLEHFLPRMGYDVTAVASGKAALEVLNKTDIDLVITDVRMPEMDGIETLKAIRKYRSDAGQAQLPEIILTAYADPEAEEAARKMGVRNYIQKPADTTEFMEEIRKSLN